MSKLRREPTVAIDTEADSFFAYHVKICLVQLSGAERHYLVDPLAPGMDLSPLGALLEDPAVLKILHAAANDLALLRLQYGFRVRSVFDTMLTAMVLGLPRAGLAALLEERFGVVADKTYQRSDWRQRPLSAGQLEYAVLDTLHLLELKDQLEAELLDKGREEEAAEEFLALEDTGAARPREFDPEAFRRVAGVRDLDKHRQRLLSELFVWREALAAEEDISPHRVVADRQLVQLARRRPADPGAVRRLKFLPARFSQRHAEAIVGVVRRAEELGPMTARPRPPRREDPEPPFTQLQRQLFQELRSWRHDRAEGRGVDPSRVATTATLKAVVRALPKDADELAKVEELSPFRRNEYGEEILELVGRLGRN